MGSRSPGSPAPTLAVDILGTGVAVEGPAWLLTELQPLLTDLPTTPVATRTLTVETDSNGGLRLLDDGRLVLEDIAPVVGAAAVVWRCNAIAATAPDRIVIHAAAVGGRGAVLLPGRSGAGKSTLTAACVTDGMSYLSDEYAIIDAVHGRVEPYAKPLGLRDEVLVPASQLRPGSWTGPLPPSGIVFPRYEPGARSSRTRLAPGWTLLALVSHTTGMETSGDWALPWLAGLALSLPAWQVTYEDSADARTLVRELGAEVRSPLWSAETIGPVTPGTVTVVLGDELAVLERATGKVHVLNPSAALVWTSVPDAVDGTDLQATVLARAPARSLRRSDIAATVEHLTSCGLLPATPA